MLWTDPALGTTPPLTADYAYMFNITTEEVYFNKSATTQAAANMAASTTKIATAIVVLREAVASSLPLTTTVTVLAGETIGGTTAGLQVNDVLSLLDLLYGMMLPSGNDASEVLARYIGTAIRTRTGSGTTGRVRFIEAMNALAAELGMGSTIYGSPNGIELNPAGTNTDVNRTSALDLARLAKKGFYDSDTQGLSSPTLQAIAGTTSRTVTVTGANARSYSVTNNNPLITPSLDPGYISLKGGATTSGTEQSIATLYQAPSGDYILATLIGSSTSGNRYLDIKALYNEALLAFPALTGGADTDPSFASVTFLSGGDAGFTDDSSYARTLTAVGATRVTTGPPIGTHMYSFDGVDDRIEAADAAELSMGNSNFAVEFWFRGNGSAPATVAAFLGKYDASVNAREYMVQADPSTLRVLFVSSATGSDTSLESSFALTTATMATLFNGSLHHILARRNGDEFALYVDGSKGTPVTSVAGVALHNSASKLMLGARQAGAGITFPCPVRLDEVRITKGSSRQTAVKFRPIPRALYRVAASTVTGVLAAVESGSDSAAAAGAVVVAGTLAAGDSATRDAAAASGGVAIVGTLAVAESTTRDGAAINGAVGNAVSGGLAAVEVGADAAAAAGAVVVAGMGAAFESGADTASFAGSAAALSGVLAAAESGADDATAAGLSTVAGALAAVERGADRAAIVATVPNPVRRPELREELRAYLLADPGVAEMVGSRVTWGGRPRTAVLPAVALFLIDGERDYAMGRPTGLVRSRVQADSWALTYGEAVYVSRAVRGALSGLRKVIGGVEIQGAFADLERDLSEDDAGAEEVLFRISQDYQIWHSEG
jgi:D-alanyl-D-alanine carboxypeptidase